jgi:predicted amidohydrolase YtcJ
LKTSKTKIIDGNNTLFVFPGFIDTHCHLLGGSRLFYQGVVLQNLTSVGDFKQKLKKYIEEQPENKWIIGGEFIEFKRIRKVESF